MIARRMRGPRIGMVSRSVAVVVVGLLGTVGLGSGEESLFERNRAVLLASLPEGAALEVWVGDEAGGEWQVWTREEYATFRATFAAQMGRDYAAPAAEGAPAAPTDQLYMLDIWSDLWGELRIHADTGPCMPRFIPYNDKLWLYRGSCGVAELRNECLLLEVARVCSNSYGWTYPQGGSDHGDAWFAYSGRIVQFPPPLGALASFDGVLLAEGA